MEILVDLMDTYQSLPDWLKLLWLVVPPGFVLALTAITLRYRFACHKLATAAASASARETSAMQLETIGSLPHLPTPAQNLPQLPQAGELEFLNRQG